MKAAEILMREHRIIERMIGVLEAEVSSAAKKGRLDEGTARTAVTFIKEYADGLHHKKEEDLLFKAMADAGFPVNAGPVGVMLYEHAEGRKLTAAMRDALGGAAAGEPSDLKDFSRAAAGYAGLLLQHIAKEDNVLYPMAAQALPPEAQERLAAEFERIDAAAAGLKKRHEDAVRELGERYGVAEPQSQPMRAGRVVCGGAT
ncbi:MAG: hemerythrin domain-containing protein [Elusimicrobia bacterium]|nr:hemerythrin domain-containing protein [Elusimicrobiota bacterium]